MDMQNKILIIANMLLTINNKTIHVIKITIYKLLKKFYIP